jgi:hypothetical protein
MEIPGVTEAMAKARASLSDADFNNAARLLNNAMDVVREKMQAAMAPTVGELITKLKGKEPISSEDLQVARLWIVGDAEAFAKAQSNFDQLVSKFGVLEESLKRCEQRGGSVAELTDVHGLLEEAVRVSYDIAKCLEAKERVRNFEASISEPSKINRQLLADILSRKLESHTM